MNEPKIFKYRFFCDVNFAGCQQQEVFEYTEEPTPYQLETDLKEWANEQIEIEYWVEPVEDEDE